MQIDKIRADFPILKRKINGQQLVYFDSAATSQKPKQVIEAIVDYYEKHNANVHRGIHSLSEEATSMVEAARDKVAELIGADREEVIFVRNASEALNLIMYTWADENINKGDEVVVSLMEHHSNLVPWQVLCRKKQARLKIIDVTEEGELMMSGNQGSKRMMEGVEVGPFEELLSEKTKLVGVTQVSNVLGTINDIDAVREVMKRRAPRAKLVVDGSQSVPHMEVRVNDLKADFLVFSGHKMLGPSGIGVLWGRKALLQNMKPFLYGGDMIKKVELNSSKWNELPYKFEAGTPNMAGMVGMGAAVDYLLEVGMDEIREHEKELIEHGLRKMEELEKEGVVEIYGSRDANKRGGVLTFNVVGVHAHDTAQILDGYGIAVRSGQHCGAPVVEKFGVTAMARASFYIYNTKQEIDYMVEKIREVRKVFKL